jgi:hypothetical protein
MYIYTYIYIYIFRNSYKTKILVRAALLITRGTKMYTTTTRSDFESGSFCFFRVISIITGILFLFV